MIIKWFIINYNICLSQLWSMIPSLGIYVWLAYIWWAENQFFFRKESCSVVSHSLRPLWNSPDQNIGADSLSFQSPTPAARDSTWRGEQCWREMRQPLSFLGLPIYLKLKILFYTFTKALGQRFDIFSSPSPRFIISINHCCSSNRVPASVILSESALSSIIYLF